MRLDYGQHRATANALVVRWEWYSWHAFDLRPLHYERDLLVPGRRLDERPPLDRDHHRIGFDAEGRAVAILEYSGFLGGKLYYETYRDYSVDGAVVREAHFYADGQPIYLHEYHFEAGLIRSATIETRSGRVHEKYHYTGNRVTRVDESRRVINASYGDDGDGDGDGDGGLVRLEIVWNRGHGGSTELVYERPPAGFTIEQACQAVHDELVRQIPAAVQAMALTEPSYCAALAYSLDHPTEITIHIGLSTDVDGADSPDILWNPADMSQETEPDLSAVAGTSRLLHQELKLLDTADITAARTPGSERGRALLCAVAAELNTLDWTTITPITEDFIVYAVDLELADLDRNLPACVPAHRLATLHERGLL